MYKRGVHRAEEPRRAGAAPGAASQRSHHLPKLQGQEQLQGPGRAAVAALAGASNPQRPRREEARE